jgi:hypothetical protein
LSRMVGAFYAVAFNLVYFEDKVGACSRSTQDGCGRVRDSGEGAWTCVLNECCDSRGYEENGELMLELYKRRGLGGVLEGNEPWASRGRR